MIPPTHISIIIFEQRLSGASWASRPGTQSSCHRGLALAPPWSKFATFGLPRSTFRFLTSIFWLPTSFSQSQSPFSSFGSPSGGEFRGFDRFWNPVLRPFSIRCSSLSREGRKHDSIGKTNIKSIISASQSINFPINVL